MTWRPATRLLMIAVLASTTACGDDGGSGSDDGGPGAGGDGGNVIRDDAGNIICIVTECGGHLLECGDCEDNDVDERIDSEDPECLGACDNTEGPALNADVGGESGGPCKADCYFDFGNGPGNDDCHWDHQCDDLQPEVDCAYDEEMLGSDDCPADQSDECLDFCRPLTPNGCDCFGCCTFPELDGGYVWIQNLDEDGDGTCTFDAITDPEKCPPCTPVEDCSNDCAECEICVGQEELPPECEEQVCPDGTQQCGQPGDDACPEGSYCVTGCCANVVD